MIAFEKANTGTFFFYKIKVLKNTHKLSYLHQVVLQGAYPRSTHPEQVASPLWGTQTIHSRQYTVSSLQKHHACFGHRENMQTPYILLFNRNGPALRTSWELVVFPPLESHVITVTAG